ncbi:MAG: thiolase family protein [Bacteriovoracaceae bacterium]|nr:thiolase family protein [Bacteriovoracaceae bacterium]
MKNIYITYAKRTPIGNFAGSLSSVRVDDLLATLFKHFKNQCSFDLKEIDDVIVGCANQAGEDNRNLARMSSLLAGFPFEVPGTTVNRLCGSSLDAIQLAYAKIQAGLGDCIVVGGAESMSRAPYVMSKADNAFSRAQQMWDTSLGWRFPNAEMEKLFPLLSMGETAEEVAKEYKIARADQDKFAFASHQKALKAQKENLFKDEIVPVLVKDKKQEKLIATDEGPRADTNLDKLASLRPVFKKDGSVTAGNSSSINDGASCVLVVSEEFLKRHNLKPLLKITGAAVAGLHPNVMGVGPIYATQKLCQKLKIKATDFDAVELNEAFAAQSLACLRELKLDEAKVNMNGGAIALGHPLGSSGARIVTTLAHIMQKNNLQKGLATMCIGVGQGIALSVENCK